MKKIPVHVQIVIGLILGVVWSLVSSWMGWESFTSNWIAPWGRIFISLLKLIAVPLIVFSIVSGVASLGSPKELGRMGISTVLLFLSTSILAVTAGLAMALLFKPGERVSDSLRKENRIQYEKWCVSNGNLPADGRFIYSNLSNHKGHAAEAALDASLFAASKEKQEAPLMKMIEELVPDNIVLAMSDNRSMLKVIMFGVLFGIAFLYVPKDKTSVVRLFFEGGALIVMKMVDIIMIGAPFFVFCLMAGVIGDMTGNDVGAIVEVFKGLGVYVLAVVSGLLAVLVLLYPLYQKIFTGNASVINFYRSIAPAQMLGFSSSSSAAALPVSMECAEKNLGISSKVTSFVLPIGATINMDGSSLYLAVAAVFTAQLHMVDLSLSQMGVIMLTCLMGSIGAAAVPGAAVVMLMVVLSSVGLNPAWVAVILPVDRILDMARTVVNITGDLTVANIIQHRFVDSTSNLPSDIEQ